MMGLGAHTLFRGNDETSRLADSLLMTHRTFIADAAHPPHWWHRLQVQWRWMRADVQQMDRLPLLRLAAAVLVALLALATASGLVVA